MTLQSPEEVHKYLLDKQWVTLDESIQIEPMGGGVSNQVWKITGNEYTYVMKQALPKLKVEADWYSDVRRIERESAAMIAYGLLLDEGTVPQVICEDNSAHTYMMTCAPEATIPWKQELMLGRFDKETAYIAGRVLSDMHSRSATMSEELSFDFGDLTFFDELRIDPFYRYLISSYPELSSAISPLISQLTEQRSCLVHGDFSPKNILITLDRRLIVIDFEVAHWGNPSFDVAFFITHLMLKGWALGKTVDASMTIEAFLHGYDGDVDHVLAHLGVMLLARIDGKSPVEYINNNLLREKIRNVGREWLLGDYNRDMSSITHLNEEIYRMLEVK